MEFQSLAGLDKPPIAIGFLEAAPEGVGKWDGGAAPAGCAFWKAAFAGKSFYTEPADHENCAVGAHTHGITAPERAAVLMDTVGFMVENGYIRMEEVAGIPALGKGPKVIAYGPVGEAGFAADVVLMAARPGAAMVLFEAAVRAGVAGGGSAPAMGRPACAVLPLAVGSQGAALSLGCKGNRTFTGLPEEEMYFCVPGAKWREFTESFAEIQKANVCMGAHYREQAAKFAVIG